MAAKTATPFLSIEKRMIYSISFLKECLDRAKVKDREKIDAFRRLAQYERRPSAEERGQTPEDPGSARGQTRPCCIGRKAKKAMIEICRHSASG